MVVVLPAAGRADQDHELSVGNGEIQVLEDRGLAIALGDVFKLDHIVAFTPLSLLAGGRPLRRWGFHQDDDVAAVQFGIGTGERITVWPRRMATMVPPVDCQNFSSPMLLPMRGVLGTGTS